MDRDIIVIGGGPGGYVAAIRAAQLGAKVSVIEKDRLGGTCLNRGCIPTKALYRNAEILNILKSVDEYGINVDNFSIDVDKIHERKQTVINQLVGGIEQLLKANHIDVIKGTAILKDKNTIQLTTAEGSEKELTARNIIIATGSKPAVPPIPGADLEGIYTSEDILNFKEVPKSLVVIGGGVVGMEFAGIFNAMGTKVTVVEYMAGILSQVDSDLTKRLTVFLKRKGIDINTSCKVIKIEKAGKEFVVFAEGKKGEMQISTEAVLVSAGRTPITEGLNLEGMGISFDRKGIKVDECYETEVKGIYAIGDVNGKMMLAHAASHQGTQVAEKIMGYVRTNEDSCVDKEEEVAAAGKSVEKKDILYHNHLVPACIFIFPEIAYIGMTEEEVKVKGISYKTSKFMFGANGKALALGEPEGMVKVISTADNEVSGEGARIIGVHIMGPHASDLIHEGALAVSNNMTVEHIEKTIHAHPTLAEAFHEAVLGLNGVAIHMVPAKNK